jgi:hypothetical protein
LAGERYEIVLPPQRPDEQQPVLIEVNIAEQAAEHMRMNYSELSDKE